MNDGFVGLSPAGQHEAKLDVGQRILRVAGQRMSPQRLAVTPVPRLLPGAGHQADHRQRASHAAEPTPSRPVAKESLDSPTGPPDNSNAQANLRQVSVTIGPGMFPYLHQPDHGHQHTEVPQPAHQHGGLLSP